MSAADVIIRAAGLADAEAMARLHVAVWQATYRDLAPPEAIRRLDFAYRQARWLETLEKAERTALVTEIGAAIVGIGTAGAPTVPELGAHGEILHLYVDAGDARRGIGRALMHRLALALQAQGYRSVALGVVEGNDAAIAFYKQLGGRAAGSYIDPGPIWRSRNQIITWDDLNTLLGRTRIAL
ncbi:GNAT family N-acetyltransferase [Dongia sedimenti]|uniref:GNAT family N-acetyltransferase n=1 Tax=Dongia sedimenti TaxID=3064282 RepID=A0ABU0YF03_9PROT|nr:GNAT family N-acetyltransferase [Rhodospirillaceae bacterium R-7]